MASIVTREAVLQFGKHMRYPRSLRMRLALWNVLILIFTLLTLGGIVYAVVTYNLQASLDKRLITQGEKLQVATHIWLRTGHPVNEELFEQLAESMQQDEFSTDDLYIKLFDATTGQPLQYSPNLKQTRIRYAQHDFAAATHGQTVLGTYQDREGNAVRVLTLPVQDTLHHTIAIAQIGRSLAGVQQVQALLMLVLCLGGTCAILVAFGAGLFLTNREIQPLRELSTQMRNLSVGGLGVRLDPKRQITEVHVLTEAFNQMSQRLEASFTLQQHFVADVSHELRTPLTALRGQIDVLLMNPEMSEEVSQDVQQIRTELIRLSHLVNNLLAMARVDVGLLPEVSEESAQRVELDLLLVEIARQARFLNQHITVELGQLHQIWVRGERDALKQMLLNIVENALTYTPAAGKVLLEVIETDTLPRGVNETQDTPHTTWARMSVRDTGPGIAALDLPHIFERYYRATHTKSRSRLGAGIGLSLARLIARAHHGDISVESELTKGTSFHIWLPIAQEPKDPME